MEVTSIQTKPKIEENDETLKGESKTNTLGYRWNKKTATKFGVIHKI